MGTNGEQISMAMQVIWTDSYNKSLDDMFSCVGTIYSMVTLKKIAAALKQYEPLLVENPFMGGIEESLKRCRYEYRYIVIKPYFKVIYRVEDDKIYFIRIWDTRRDPSLLRTNIK